MFSSGVGQQIAIKLAEQGVIRLFLVDLNDKGLHETKKYVEEKSSAAQVALHLADVSNASSVKAMVDECVKIFGRLDFAANNAGIGLGGTRTHETDTAMFEKLYKVNEKGVYLCTKYEVQQFLKQEPLDYLQPGDRKERQVRGSIVNTASLSGTASVPTLSSYNSVKHAVVSMTKNDARQYAPSGIRVNAVSPGFTLTPMLTGGGAGLDEAFYAGAKLQSPMNRMTFPEEVAEAVAFLSGSRASAISGVNLHVDAGASLYHVI
ncbi:hypothetical protein A1O3_08995 [Capronia epimyces CBS 606.96]|uniref:3-oxoacyl-[acyl-carrier protein] reductase n=1 Tax=Capronia epimyces CBS 606.96 TaxID=1182542 RepID=W9XLL4_9EURO|nr:uncharacterized protein A1O3_08995 [Capronia epimyces CBS 606.96]EXJ77836.1 hypothetical protein A1O3_08995 [Capronia epimyces CBS 606.96]